MLPFKESIESKEFNIVELMKQNVLETKEYYVINKRHANRAFSASLVFCILGFILYASGLIHVILNEGSDITLIAIVSGTVVELVSGLFFWLYTRTTNQLALFHERLVSTEQFLAAIHLVEDISESERDKAYINLIDKIMSK